MPLALALEPPSVLLLSALVRLLRGVFSYPRSSSSYGRVSCKVDLEELLVLDEEEEEEEAEEARFV